MLSEFIDSDLFSYLYPVTLIASVVGGYIVARKYWVKKNRIWKPSGIEGGVIGFFSLVISFTLIIAGNSMRDRVALLHQEADGAAQMLRDADLYGSTQADSIRSYLKDVMRAQILFDSLQSYDPAALRATVTRRSVSFWKNFAMQDKQSDSTWRKINLFQPHYNLFTSSFYRFVYSYEERMSLRLILLITISSYLIGILVGFMSGMQPEKNLLVLVIYVFLVTATMETILDVNDPYQGIVRPNYENLKDIYVTIKR